jgi:hypothetical protein
VRIERQLALLDEFWASSENAGLEWSGNRVLQERYYRFMQKHGFVDGDAARPDKDAREKTSGLTAIGLIDSKRKPTPAGTALLDISRRGDFNRDNLLQIPADSLIYLKQLLKTSNDVGGSIVRPFVVTAYALLRLEHLTDDEFTYLLPLCVTRESTETIIDAIENLRSGNDSIDAVITSRIMAMDNYKAALNYFLTERVTESVITTIGMNRKSGRAGKKAYDKPYFPFYETLRDIALNRNGEAVLKLYEQSHKIRNQPGTLWRQYLFRTTARRRLECDGLAALNDVPLLYSSNENEFKRLFFEQMHLFKVRANLNDYADLNRRYFKTTDTVIFVDGKIELDMFPRCWMHSASDDLLSIAFTPADNLAENVDLSDISAFLAIDEQLLYVNLRQLYGVVAATAAEAGKVINDRRYERFNALIDARFDRSVLIDLFGNFERREDDAIRQAVTNNADIPTIFEYVVGIAWYLISDRRGDVLSYMNLSLEADLLPRTHAVGGSADIEYVYTRSAAYPAHTLLIEATLADGTNQRRMEMEPVSRHTGEYILSHGDTNAYCLFVSTFLNRNVISDFRNRRTYKYYGLHEKFVEGLKILVLATPELRIILEHGIGYDMLYSLFESAYRSDEPVPSWYEKEVVEKLYRDINYGDDA